MHKQDNLQIVIKIEFMMNVAGIAKWGNKIH